MTFSKVTGGHPKAVLGELRRFTEAADTALSKIPEGAEVMVTADFSITIWTPLKGKKRVRLANPTSSAAGTSTKKS